MGHAHITVRGPGRCAECSFHVATHGHRESCSGTAPVQLDQPAESTTDARGRPYRFLSDGRIHCPHCGPVIVCKHTQYAGGVRHQDAPDAEQVWDGLSFLQRVARRRGEPYRRSTQPPSGPCSSTGLQAQPGQNPRYVDAAIRADLDRLAVTREGRRNGTLHSVACNIFEFVKGGHVHEAAARAELERIATAIGLGHYEIRATLKSAWGRVGPRGVPAPASVAAAYTVEGPAS